MGYLTLHAIRIINKYNTRNNLKKLKRVIEIMSDYSFDIKGSILTDYICTDGDGYKWYDCNCDMPKISRLLPKLEIQICGKGEDEGDEWSFIFENGNRYKSFQMFIYDLDADSISDFNEETESNHCSIISCSSSENEEEKEEDEEGENEEENEEDEE